MNEKEIAKILFFRILRIGKIYPVSVFQNLPPMRSRLLLTNRAKFINEIKNCTYIIYYYYICRMKNNATVVTVIAVTIIYLL